MIRVKLLAALLMLASVTASAQLTSADFRAWYPLTENAEDRSGNGLHGVLPGSGMDPAFVSDTERRMVAEFDGIDDYVDISATLETFSECSPNGQLAISMWVKTNGTGGDPLTQNVVMGAEPNGGVLEIAGTGSWGGMGSPAGAAFGINSGGGGGSTGRAAGALAGALQDGQWHHLFIQWVDPDGTLAGNDAAEAEIWIDGSLAEDANGSTSFAGSCAGERIATLGKGNGSNGYGQEGFRYTGRMSDVILFNRQLTANEIAVAMHILFLDGFEDGLAPWSTVVGSAPAPD